MLTALNLDLRNEYVADCANGQCRNQELEDAGPRGAPVPAPPGLQPQGRFLRRPPCLARPARSLDEATWEGRVGDYLPTPDDRARCHRADGAATTRPASSPAGSPRPRSASTRCPSSTTTSASERGLSTVATSRKRAHQSAAPTARRPTSSTPPPWLVTRHAAGRRRTRRAITAIDLDGSVRTLSYAELDQEIRFAAALMASGVRPEERLLLCMGDTPELLTAFLAGLRIGAVPVPVSTMLKPKDIAVLARDSRARLVALSSEFAALAPAVGRAARPRRRRGPGRLRDALPEVAGTRVLDWESFVAPGADFVEQAAAPYPTVADSPAFWLYTSGTTGTPKGAMHRHGSLRDTAETYARDVLGHRSRRRHVLGGEVLLRLRPRQHDDVPVLGRAPARSSTARGRARPARCDSPPGAPADAVLRRADLLRGPARGGPARRRVRRRRGLRLGRRGVPGGAVRAVHRAVRSRDARRHRLDRDVAHLHQQPARPGPPRHQR